MMKIKGTATITLRDAKTGHIDFQETHSNTITPALGKIFADNLSGTLDYTKLMPLFSRLLGGVCLFNGSLDPTSVFLPSSNNATLTAHAGQRFYEQDYGMAADPKRGEPNNNPGRSGAVPNGYRWVWDWGQTQGNGTISRIALTHADTGDFWNESEPNIMAAKFEPVEDVCLHNLSSGDFYYDGLGYGLPGNKITNSKRIPIGFLDDTNHVVTIEIDEEEMRFNVYIAKFTGTGAWLWNDLGEPYDEVMYPFEVQYPQWGTWENLGYFCYYLAFDKANKKLYAYTCGWVNGGGSWQRASKDFYVDCLDLNTGTVTSEYVNCSSVLGTDELLVAPVSSVAGDPVLLQVVDGSIFFPTNTTKTLRIKLPGYSEKELIEGLYDVYEGNFSSINGAVDLGNDRICFLNNYGAKQSDGTYKGFDVLRSSSSGVFGGWSKESRVFIASQPSNSPVQYITGLGSSAPRGAILNKLYQATVFTLSTPVTKSATQTLTVEYTITQVQEDES